MSDSCARFSQAIIEKIHPCLRRDCNYANLDKIKAESRWLEDEGRWVMPKMSVEKVRMPNIGGGTYGAGSDATEPNTGGSKFNIWSQCKRGSCYVRNQSKTLCFQEEIDTHSHSRKHW